MTILEDIRSRTYMTLVVRPLYFLEDRVPYAELEDTVRRASVQWRGWDFPHIDPHTRIGRGDMWVGQESAWNHHLEVWRIWTSGQFVSTSGFASEWRDRSEWWPPDEGWSPGQTIGVMEIFLRFVEAYLFSSRLVLTGAGDETVRVELKLGGLEGRRLTMDDPRRIPYFHDYTSDLSDFEVSRDIHRDELVAEPTELAIQAARDVFIRFGLDISETNLQQALDEFKRNSAR
jgi:hypothetical protein